MEIKKLTSKILAVLLIAMLTIANSSLVLSYAIGATITSQASNEEEYYERQSKTTNNKNVEFDAFYIEKDNSITHQGELKLGEKQKIYVSVNVKKGYIKNSYVEFANANENINLNYTLSEENKMNQNLQKIEGYKVELKQLNVGNYIGEIIIEDNMKEKIPLEYLEQESNVLFQGIYVDSNGNEIAIEKEIKIKTALKGEDSTKLETKIINHETYEKWTETDTPKQVLEVRQDIFIKRENKSLPVEKEILQINVPEIQGERPSRVKVIAKELGYINGQKEEEVVFGKSNYEYHPKTGEITITTTNENSFGMVWSGLGTDHYVVIYEYDDMQTAEWADVKSKVNVTINTYENKTLQYETEAISENIMGVQTKGIETEIKMITTEIEKGKLYSNAISEKNLYNTEFETKIGMIITEKEAQEKITILDIEDRLIGTKDIYTKELIVNKQNMEAILGETGYIKITNENGEELAQINKETEKNTLGECVVTISNQNEKINVETNRPEAEGMLYITVKKEVKKDLAYSIEDLRSVEKITSALKIGEKIVQAEIKLSEPETKATLRLNKTTLTKEIEDLEICIDLNNNHFGSDLYKNPTFRVLLPSYISNAEINHVNLVFADDEMKIKDTNIIANEEGRLELFVSLEGTQKEYIEQGTNNGTGVIIRTKINVKESTNVTENVTLYYTNENVSKYASELEIVELKAIVEKEEEKDILREDSSFIKLLTDSETRTFQIAMRPYSFGEEEMEPYTEEEEEEAQESIERMFWKENFTYNLIDVGNSIAEGDGVLFAAVIKNLTSNNVNNAIAELTIPVGLTYENAIIYNGIEDNSSIIHYNEITRVLTIQLGQIEALKGIRIGIYMRADSLISGEHKKQIVSALQTTGDGIEEQISNEVTFIIGKINITTNGGITNPDIVYKPEDNIEYYILAENIGASADNFKVKVTAPEELTITEIAYQVKEIIDASEFSPDSNSPVDSNIAELEDISIGTDEMLIVQVTLKVKEDYFGEVKQVGIKTELTAYQTIQQEMENPEEPEEMENVDELIYQHTLNTNVMIAKSDYVEDPSENYKISGVAWIDKNQDGKMEAIEIKIPNLKVKIMNAESKEIIQETITNENGLYLFKKLEQGSYQILFEYDESRYELTSYQEEDVSNEEDSDAIRLQQNSGITQVIEIGDENVRGVNIGLVAKDIFDFSLNKSVMKVTVQTSTGVQTISYNQSKLAKVEIPPQKLAGATVYIEYNITIKNEGSIAGKANKIIDYLPSGMIFSSDLNKNWYQGSDGNLYTEEFSSVDLNPGESRTIALVLKKGMTENNTGLVNNIAEIYEFSTEEAVNDVDSIPADKIQGQDDMSSADCIIGIKTGQELIYLSLIAISIVILSTGMYLIKKKVL